MVEDREDRTRIPDYWRNNSLSASRWSLIDRTNTKPRRTYDFLSLASFDQNTLKIESLKKVPSGLKRRE